MKTRTRLAISAMVALMAIGFSAFTTTGKNPTSKFATRTYYHVGDEYLDSAPANTACTADDYYCTVTVTATSLPTSFDEDQIPAGATLGTANSSWQ